MILIIFVISFAGTGCSGIAPNQLAPSKDKDTEASHSNLYAHPEHDFDDVIMD